MKNRFLPLFAAPAGLIGLAFTLAAVHAPSADAFQAAAANWEPHFFLTSSTFQNGKEVPLSMVYGACGGGDQSPELTWKFAPRDTRSFAVIMFDTTASFTHWGIYNIARDLTSLPANAGTPQSSYGEQINNDFGNMNYDGPCPPPGLVHDYVVTVYALDTELRLPSSSEFPANAETLFRALIGHVIASASITGLFSTT